MKIILKFIIGAILIITIPLWIMPWLAYKLGEDILGDF